MDHEKNDDNIYKAGTVITAKEHPDRKLVIMKYLHRIYYCAVLGDAANNHLTYFETQLTPPYADL
jgi:hypothetical protein